MFKLNRRIRSSRKGNTLTEYGFMLLIVLVLVLSPTLNLGKGLNDLMSRLKGDMRAQVSASQAIRPQGPATSKVTYPRQMGSTICYSVAYCLNNKIIQSQANVQVSGANGARQYIHDQSKLLADIAAAAQQDPSTDPVLLDLLSRLAAAANTIGVNLEKSIGTLNGGAGSFYWDYDAFWRSQGPYDALRDQLSAYLAQNPTALPAGVQTAVNGATLSINTELSLLINHFGPTYPNWDSMINNPVNIYQNAAIIGSGQSPPAP